MNPDEIIGLTLMALSALGTVWIIVDKPWRDDE